MSSFKNKVIYQVYPKSFKDSNGDGIGDLPGIIEKIPYLAQLGIDMIWLNPFYKSPQNDNGYDVADYKSVDPMFGTMEDFEELVRVAKKHGIELMLDMVFNHTSTEHEWFQKALAGDTYYQDFYYIRPPKADGSLPTNWQSKFGGDAWAPFGDTGNYYLHLYDVTQADLDWHNPNVQRELFDVVNFWLDKGVKGFRFDVLNVIGKDEVLVDSTGNASQEKSLYTDTPIVHEYIHAINQASFGVAKDIVTVGEMSSTTIQNGILYTNPEREELSMIFSFHHLKVDYKDGDKWANQDMDFAQLKEIMDEWQVGMQEGNGWNAVFWNNHDQPRINSRFANPEKYPFESTTMLATTIHFLRGTPYIYQGEEIGMTNPNFDSIEDYVDIESLNAYQELRAKGLNNGEAMEPIKAKSRDNSRTPMQWNAEPHAGFTTGHPWIKVAANYPLINVEQELQNGRTFKYYQELIRLRKKLPIIVEGSYRMIAKEHPSIFAYERVWDNQQLIVLNHFYEGETVIDLSEENIDWAKAKVLLTNGEISKLQDTLTLKSYQSLVILIEK